MAETVRGAAKITPPLKYHGGKSYLARRIVELMPPHKHFVEPYAGGLAVLLHKDPEGVSEVVNDLSKDLAHFWAVLADPYLFAEFRRFAEATPFSEGVWRSAAARLEGDPAALSPAQRAWCFFVRCRMSLAGRMKSFTGITKTRTRRGMNNEVSAWLSAVEGLPEVHARLKRVLILNRDALDVIRGQDGPQTLFYLDPPYCPDTRAAPEVYAHEMTGGQHAELLNALARVRGKFVLSGYRNALYDGAADAHGWRRVDFDMANHSAGGKSKRRVVESVWMNYDPPEGATDGQE